MNCKRTVSTSRRYSVILLLLFLSGFYLMFLPAPSQAATGDVHSIHGSISLTNLPLDAEVYIRFTAQDENYLYPEAFIEINYNEGNSYSLAVFEGTYNLECEVEIWAPGFSSVSFTYPIDFDPLTSGIYEPWPVTGNTPLNITIPTVQLSVNVTDSTGTIPIPYTDVGLSNEVFSIPYYYYNTDSSGALHFITLKGTNQITVPYPPSAYEPATKTVELTGDKVENVTLQDAPIIPPPVTYSLSGTVTIDNLPGDFTRDIDVYINGTTIPADPSTGEFVFEVPAGTYNVYAYVDIYNPDGGSTDINYYKINSTIVEVTTSDVDLGNFAIPTVLISGTIKDSLGAPVPDNTYIYTSGNSIYEATAYTDIDGNYRLLLFPGNYDLQVNTTPQFIEPIAVSVSETKAIVLDSIQTVSGSVTFSNLPADFDSEIAISFEDVSGVQPDTSTTIGDLGPGPFAYSLPVFVGTYNVYVTIYTYPPNGGWVRINYTAATNFPVAVEITPTLNIPIPTFMLSGTVTDNGGSTVSGTTEIYIDNDSYVTADTNGTYQYPLLAGGYTVYVFPPSPYRDQSKSITITDSNLTEHFVFDQIYTLSGSAAISNLPTGFTTSSITVYAYGPEYYSTTVIDGNYSIDVTQGTYNLRVRGDIYPPDGDYINFDINNVATGVDLTSGDAVENITISTMLLSGVVKNFEDLGGSPVPDTEFYSNGYGHLYDVTGADGIYQVLEEPGTYTFIVRPPPSLHPPFYLEDVDLSTDLVWDLQFGQLDFIDHGVSTAPDVPEATDADQYLSGNKIVPGPVMPDTTIALPLSTSIFTDPNGNAHVETHWRVRRADHPFVGYVVDTDGLTTHSLDGLEPGLRYIWQVRYVDSDLEESPWSDEYGFLVGDVGTDASTSAPSGTGVADYIMVTFPTWPTDPSSEAVLTDDMQGGYNKTMYRFGTYDAMSGIYKEFGPNLKIVPGRAYWVLARNGLPITVDGVEVSLSADIEVPLDYGTTGWNMVGPPNKADYWWADIQVMVYNADGTEFDGPLTIENASEYIDTTLWSWENGNYISETPPLDDPIMYQNEGYWVRALRSGVSLRFRQTVQQQFAQVEPSSPIKMLAQKINQGLFRLKQILATPTAVADAGDSPPLPMGSLADSASAAGGCFIATAAYGSYLESHVMTLRQFRDSYLLTNKPGTEFVKAYYRYSPPMADFIAEHDSLKPIVRIGLSPLVGFSFLAIHYGIMVALAVLLSALTLIVGGISFAMKTREANY